jgi:hypothetical protein
LQFGRASNKVYLEYLGIIVNLDENVSLDLISWR